MTGDEARANSRASPDQIRGFHAPLKGPLGIASQSRTDFLNKVRQLSLTSYDNRRMNFFMARNHSLPRPTDAELEMLRVLWKLGPSTVRGIHDAVSHGKDTGYTTTLKILQKMADKGLVRRDESQRSHVYEPVMKAEQTQLQLVRDLMSRAFGGAPGKMVMQALADESATPEELAEIRGIVRQLRNETEEEMMSFTTAFVEALGWTLLHFVWQGAAIAFLFAVLNQCWKNGAPNFRYGAAALAMMAMVVTAVGTFFFYYKSIEESVRPAFVGIDAAPMPVADLRASAALSELTTDSSRSSSWKLHSVAPPAMKASFSFGGWYRGATPWIVGAWLLGVLLLSLRLLNGWLTVRRWQLEGSSFVEAARLRRFQTLCDQLGLTRSVRLLTSAKVAAPMVIGWLRPVVLVPVSLFTGLSANALDTILVHELTHIRRHDYLVNLLQCMVETVFFYHPAVWWVSCRMRLEREHCCDDAAAAYSGDAIAYARALTTVSALCRPLQQRVGVAATYGLLMRRVRRVVGLPSVPGGVPSHPWPLLASILVVLVLGARDDDRRSRFPRSCRDGGPC